MPAQPANPAVPAQPTLKLRGELRGRMHQSRGGPFYVVEDPVASRFFRLGVREWTFAGLLDGTNSIARAAELTQARLAGPPLEEAEAAALCRWLLQAGLVRPVVDDAGRSVALGVTVPSGSRRGARVSPFFIQIPLFNPNKLLSRIEPWLGWTLGRVCLALWFVLLGTAAYDLAVSWDRFVAASASVLLPRNWPYLIAIWIALKIVHELYHGVACKRHGGTVPSAGIAFILFSPVPFVDVTSCWRFRSRWQRMQVSLAGLYAELALAAAATILWSRTAPGIFNQCCHHVVIAASLTTILFNVNPLMRFDGYYVLSDLLDVPNLYGLGRQYVARLGRRYLLGFPDAGPGELVETRRVVKAYGLAAAVWRVMVCVGLSLGAVHLFHGAGLALSVVGVSLWAGLPLVRLVRSFWSENTIHRPSVPRVATVALLAGAAVYGAFLLPWPGGAAAPAVVEYAPLAVVRAACPGFVREVCVRGGQPVEKGQVLARLENDQVQSELADLDLAIAESQAKARVMLQNDRVDQYQAEIQNHQALEQRRGELQRQVAGLTIRAPAAGRVVGRNLDDLVGRYFDEGESLVAIGREDRKELTASVSQADVELFAEHVGTRPTVRVQGRAEAIRDGRLVKVEPKATTRLPNPALGAPAGGPLAVRRPGADDRSDHEANDPFELASPRFTATVALSAEQSAGLRAGQRAYVCLHARDDTIGSRAYGRVQRWVHRKLNRGRRPSG